MRKKPDEQFAVWLKFGRIVRSENREIKTYFFQFSDRKTNVLKILIQRCLLCFWH